MELKVYRSELKLVAAVAAAVEGQRLRVKPEERRKHFTEADLVN